MKQILLFSGSFILLSWGIAHLFPTKEVVKNFGKISVDNQRIITMEWIIEGITLVFIATLVATLAAIDPNGLLSCIIFIQSIVMLNVLSIVSLFTGFKNKFWPYRLCPVIFTGTSLLIALGIIVK
jgi:hypothetical protein